MIDNSTLTLTHIPSDDNMLSLDETTSNDNATSLTQLTTFIKKSYLRGKNYAVNDPYWFKYVQKPYVKWCTDPVSKGSF